MKFDVISHKVNKNKRKSPIIVHNEDGLLFDAAKSLALWLHERTPGIGVIEVIKHIKLSEGEVIGDREVLFNPAEKDVE